MYSVISCVTTCTVHIPIHVYTSSFDQNFFRHFAPMEGTPYGIHPEVMDTYVKSCGECSIASSPSFSFTPRFSLLWGGEGGEPGDKATPPPPSLSFSLFLFFSHPRIVWLRKPASHFMVCVYYVYTCFGSGFSSFVTTWLVYHTHGFYTCSYLLYI